MSIQINDGGPVFPVPTPESTDGRTHDGGMTLRDWFAGQALAGYAGIADERTCPKDKDVKTWAMELAENDARYCYFLADAMIKQREVQS